jgi:antitoxin (DNA-binding transcriptional repressor) of toxin-antitoxin stability system
MSEFPPGFDSQKDPVAYRVEDGRLIAIWEHDAPRADLVAFERDQASLGRRLSRQESIARRDLDPLAREQRDKWG